MSQRELIEYFEDWSDFLTITHDAGLLTTPKAIQAIRKIDIKKIATAGQIENDFSRTRSALETIELEQNADLPIPTDFDWHSRLFDDTETRVINVRIGLKTDADEPTFKLRIIQHDAHLFQISEELKQRFTDFAEISQIYNGDIKVNQ